VQRTSCPAGWPQLELVLRVLIEKARSATPRPEVDGLYGLTAWQSLWKTARESPDTEHAVCPYRGLESYQREHAASFRGREKSTDALLKRLDAGVRRRRRAADARRALRRGQIVAAAGRAGAGHPGTRAVPGRIEDLANPDHHTGSDPVRELVRRIPDLKEPLDPAGWQDDAPDGVSDTSPDRDAPRALDAAAVRAAITTHAEQQAGSGARLIIVVDQFEEVFPSPGTASGTSTSRRCGRRAPGERCLPPPRPWWSLACARIFNEGCLDDPTLAEALQERQMVLGPMTDEELHEGRHPPGEVGGPAGGTGAGGAAAARRRAAGVSEVPRRRGCAAAVVPRTHRTWGKRKRRADHRRLSGGEGDPRGRRGTAEQAWAELDQQGQRAALNLLLKLTRIGADGSHDTRGRCDKQQLLDQAPDRASAETALESWSGRGW